MPDYRNEYRRKNYDTITLLLPKGKREEIKAEAEKKIPPQSLNQYIVEAIIEKMERG